MRRVIKSSETGRRSVSDFQHDALERLFELADEENPVQAADILAAAREEAEAKVREAYNEGLRRGQEEGRKRFEEAVAESAAALREAAAAIHAANETFLVSLEPEVVALAFSLAERILQREAATDPAIAAATARAALEHLVGGERVVIRVNPRDLDAMRAQKLTLLEQFDGIQQIDVVPDEHVAPGGCLVDSELSHVDARISSQLQNLLDGIQE